MSINKLDLSSVDEAQTDFLRFTNAHCDDYKKLGPYIIYLQNEEFRSIFFNYLEY